MRDPTFKVPRPIDPTDPPWNVDEWWLRILEASPRLLPYEHLTLADSVLCTPQWFAYLLGGIERSIDYHPRPLDLRPEVPEAPLVLRSRCTDTKPWPGLDRDDEGARPGMRLPLSVVAQLHPPRSITEVAARLLEWVLMHSCGTSSGVSIDPTDPPASTPPTNACAPPEAWPGYIDETLRHLGSHPRARLGHPDQCSPNAPTQAEAPNPWAHLEAVFALNGGGAIHTLVDDLVQLAWTNPRKSAPSGRPVYLIPNKG